ncbi:hypothetical protein FQN54_005141 [Arachnomyces sp. PD_36]|nr:hypothetical protein FQN54_005141 [Arachnomyces sp. PD_36]
MADSHSINFEDVDRNWYNAFLPAPADLFQQGNRGNYRYHPASSPTLHGYQSVGAEMRCGIYVGNDNVWKGIPLTESTHVRFEVAGGAEIPHFSLTLRLKPQGPEADQAEEVVLKLVWTTWGERGFDTDRQAPGGTQTYTFSNRLMNMHVREIPHTAELAAFCNSREGTQAFRLEWAHHVAPYCYGFGIPASVFEHWLNRDQRYAFAVFQDLGRPNRGVRVVTHSQGMLGDFLRFVTSMPVPTPAPYPLYDCVYYPGQETFGRIATIPEIDSQDIQNHHCRREKGWVNQPPAFVKPAQIMSMHSKAPLTFINEREYEVVKTVGLLREASHQRDIAKRQFWKEYTFTLIPASTFRPTDHVDSNELYYALLDVTPRERPSDIISESPDLPEPGTPVRVTPLDPALKKTPDRGSSALIKYAPSTSQSEERWVGVVVSEPQLRQSSGVASKATYVAIQLRKPHSVHSGGLVLKMTAFIEFGALNPPYAQARTALRYAMYGNPNFDIPPDNIIKTLLLGHDNHVLKFIDCTGTISPEADDYVSTMKSILNEKQLEALRSAFTIGNTLRDLITLVIGPPGTGKTQVIANIAKHCFDQGKPILIVCGSNYALDITTKRINSLIHNTHSVPEGVFRLGTEFGESHEIQSSGSHDPPQRFQEEQLFPIHRMNELLTFDVTPSIFTSLKSWVEEKGATGHDLSLGKHVVAQLEKARQLGSNWPRTTSEDEEEYTLLWELITWKRAIATEDRVFAQPVNPLSGESYLFDNFDEVNTVHKRLILGLRSAWEELQGFYLRHAKIVLCTAFTAGRKALRNFKPMFVVADEASQMSESTCVNGFIRSYSTLKKLILSGDPAQLSPTVTSLNTNECYESEKLSLFERLIQARYPSTQLEMQYRMHPHIAQFVSEEFYNGSLITHMSCRRSSAIEQFQKFMKTLLPACASGSSYFISIKSSKLWQKKGSMSLFNPEYVCAIATLIPRLVKAGCGEAQILVLSFYSEERRILSSLLVEKLGYKNIRVQSVDASQGNENDIVLLSTTRPGGSLGLGFVADRQRQCVALSRAKAGLIIFGSEQMAGLNKSGGFRSWGKLIDDHRYADRLYSLSISDDYLRQTLSIPNDTDYVQMTQQ